MGNAQHIRNVVDTNIESTAKIANTVAQDCTHNISQVTNVKLCGTDIHVDKIDLRNVAVTDIQCNAIQNLSAKIDSQLQAKLEQAAQNSLGALSQPLSTQDIQQYLNLTLKMSSEIIQKGIQNCSSNTVQANNLAICNPDGSKQPNTVYVGSLTAGNTTNGLINCIQDASVDSEARQALEVFLSQKASNKATGLFDGILGFIILLIVFIVIIAIVFVAILKGGGGGGDSKKKAWVGAIVTLVVLLLIYFGIAYWKKIWPFAPELGK